MLERYRYRYRYLVYADEETDMIGLKELLKSRSVEGKDIEFIVYKGTVTKGKELEINREFPDSLFREIAKGISIFDGIETAEVGAKTETMENSNTNTNTRILMQFKHFFSGECVFNGRAVLFVYGSRVSFRCAFFFVPLNKSF